MWTMYLNYTQAGKRVENYTWTETTVTQWHWANYCVNIFQRDFSKQRLHQNGSCIKRRVWEGKEELPREEITHQKAKLDRV